MQNIGLFNQNKPAFNMATTSTGFSFGQNTATNTGSVFGAKPPGTSGFTSTFGNPTSSFGTNSVFGASQNQSLFSQPFKPATSGFSFGQTAPTGTGLGKHKLWKSNKFIFKTLWLKGFSFQLTVYSYILFINL
jgi:hypothetical protein